MMATRISKLYTLDPEGMDSSPRTNLAVRGWVSNFDFFAMQDLAAKQRPLLWRRLRRLVDSCRTWPVHLPVLLLGAFAQLPIDLRKTVDLANHSKIDGRFPQDSRMQFGRALRGKQVFFDFPFQPVR